MATSTQIDDYIVAKPPKNAAGAEKVPAGKFAILSMKDGKATIIGYTDGNGGNEDSLNPHTTGKNVVFFSNAPQAVIAYYAKSNTLTQTATDASDNTKSFVKTTTAPAATAAAPKAAAVDPNDPTATTTPAASTPAGGYVAGATGAQGNLNAISGISQARDPGNIDTSKLSVVLSSSIGAGAGKAAVTADTGSSNKFQAQHPNADQSTGTSNVTGDIRDIVDGVFQMVPDDRAALTKKLTDAGYAPSDGSVYGLAAAYEKALLDLNQMETNANGTNGNLSVGDFLAQQTAAQAAGGGASNKTITSTSSDTTLTDPTTAEGIINQAFKDHLGRQATAPELAAFQQALNAAQKAAPTNKSTTTTGSSQTLDGQTAGNTSASSTTTGGLDPSTFADNYVQNAFGPEASADKMAGAYSLFESALGSGGVGSGA